MTFSKENQKLMLDTAWQALDYGLKFHQPMVIDIKDFPTTLQAQQASFVTLELQGNLRGCIGSLIASEPLIQDIAHNAFRAGFKDPRFRPINAPELSDLTLEISILSKPEPLPVESEQDLLSKLKVGYDGLILKESGYQSTFLPTVWSQLTTPEEFLAHLKLKAGLPANHWSNTISFYRYHTELIK